MKHAFHRPNIFMLCVLASSCLAWSCGGGFRVASSPAVLAMPMQAIPSSLGGYATTSYGVVPDTWKGIVVNQHFDGDITDAKKTAYAPQFDLVYGSDNPKAWKAGNLSIVTTMYAPYNGDFSLQRSLSWWKQYHPSWVLYKCDRKTPAWPSYLRNVPLDISNPEVVKWQMATYAPAMIGRGFSGLGADLVDLTDPDGACGVFVNGVWTQKFSGQSVDDTWAKATLAWLHYAYSYLHSTSPKLVLGVNNVPEFRPMGDAEETDLINHVDFLNDESSFSDYGNSFASNGKVLSILEWMKYTQSQNRTWLVDTKWNTSSITNQQLGWAIAGYLLGKYHSASLFTDHDPGYGYYYWFAQYGDAVGTPCGDFYTDPKHPGTYFRKYSGAFVALNATTGSSYTVALPKTNYSSIFGGTVVSPMVMAPTTGYVLLTSNGCL